jgi:hypothetical protein
MPTPTYSLTKAKVVPVAPQENPAQLITHLRFKSENDAWNALRQLMARGFDASGWFVRTNHETDPVQVEDEAA